MSIIPKKKKKIERKMYKIETLSKCYIKKKFDQELLIMITKNSNAKSRFYEMIWQKKEV